MSKRGILDVIYLFILHLGSFGAQDHGFLNIRDHRVADVVDDDNWAVSSCEDEAGHIPGRVPF